MASQAATEIIDRRSDRPGRGILLMCIGVATLILLEMSAKSAAAAGVPVAQTVWVRFAVHLLAFALIFGPRMGKNLIATANLKIQLARSLLLLLMTLASFLALKHLQMAQVTSIGFATPLLVAALSVPILKEVVGFHRWSAILVGFLGVLLVVRPGMDGMHWAMLVLLGGITCYSFYLILTRQIAGKEDPVTSVFYTALFGAIFMSLPMPWVWQTPETGQAWAFMLLTGIFGGFAHFLIIIAHQYAPASLLAPFYYTQIVWSVLVGFIAFGDKPDGFTIAGAGVVIASGLYLMAREKRTKRRA
ncbi:DMT family transporter [Aestuariispira ectoiniformans]|uniref:DMT family transporter n=1 Tax=Aestuariispira ectoiniformans TaxID=2775080 RepID=UPI00223A9D1D|nr:DMT family transporter [Aestuariispira ectoiniformans]